MRLCQNCKSEISETANFCPYCGAEKIELVANQKQYLIVSNPIVAGFELIDSTIVYSKGYNHIFSSEKAYFDPYEECKKVYEQMIDSGQCDAVFNISVNINNVENEIDFLMLGDLAKRVDNGEAE